MSSDDSRRGPQREPDEPGSQNRYYQRYQETSGEAVTSPLPTGPGGPRSRRGLVVTITAIVLAVLIAGVVVGINLLGSGSDQQAGPLVPSRSPSQATQAPTPSGQTDQTWVNPSASVAPTAVRPLEPGWQPVLARTSLASAAYDVPKKNWTTKRHGFGMDLSWDDSKGKKILGLGNASAYRLGYCKTNANVALAGVGFYGIHQMDPAAATPTEAKKFADAIALKKDDTSHAHEGEMRTRQTTVQGLPAVESIIVATVGNPSEKDCDPKTVEVRALGVSMGSKSTLLVLTRNLGQPDALTEQEAEAVLQTLRPVQG